MMSEPKKRICQYCGYAVEPHDTKCGTCGADLPVRKITKACPMCGAGMEEGDTTCATCGYKTAPTGNLNSGVTFGGPTPPANNGFMGERAYTPPTPTPAMPTYSAPVYTAPPKKNNTAVLVVVGIVAVVFAIIVGIVVINVVSNLIFGGSSSNGSKGPDFEELYENYCSYEWADVASDGSYLKIDTNPDDEDDNSLAYYTAYTTIEDINDELGLPESLFVEMGETTALDGMQTREFEDEGVIVTWSYHPDRGLEVMYKED